MVVHLSDRNSVLPYSVIELFGRPRRLRSIILGPLLELTPRRVISQTNSVARLSASDSSCQNAVRPVHSTQKSSPPPRRPRISCVVLSQPPPGRGCGGAVSALNFDLALIRRISRPHPGAAGAALLSLRPLLTAGGGYRAEGSRIVRVLNALPHNGVLIF